MAGLGDAIAQVLTTHAPAPQEYVAVNDSFGESGTPDQLLTKYGLDTPDIVAPRAGPSRGKLNTAATGQRHERPLRRVNCWPSSERRIRRHYAFNLLVRKYQRRLYTFIRRMVRDHDEAAGCAAEHLHQGVARTG